MRKQYSFRPGTAGLDAWDVDRLIEASAHLPVEDVAARAAVDTLISTWGKGRLKELLNKELGEVISG